MVGVTKPHVDNPTIITLTTQLSSKPKGTDQKSFAATRSLLKFKVKTLSIDPFHIKESKFNINNDSLHQEDN